MQQFELDFRVGGVERLKYKLKPGTPVAGMIITNEARYQDIVPDRWIVTAMTMDLGEKRILVSLRGETISGHRENIRRIG